MYQVNDKRVVTPAIEKGLLAFLLLAALLLRLYYLERWLPAFFEEATPVRRAAGFWGEVGGSFDFHPHFFNYPALSFYIHFAAQGVVFLFDLLRGHIASLEEFRQLLRDDLPRFVLLGRWITALFDVGTVGVTFQLGKRLAGRGGGLLAGGCVALSCTHIRLAQTVIVDVPLTFFSVLVFLAALEALQQRRTINFLKIGIYTGLAASVKYTLALIGGVVGIGALLHLVIAERDWGEMGKGVCGLATALPVFCILNPFIFLDFNTFFADFSFEVQHMARGHFTPVSDVGTVSFYAHVLWSTTGVVGIVAIAGGIAALGKRQIEAGLLFLGCVVYLGVISSWAMRAEHYVLPSVPIFFALGASAVIAGLIRLERRTAGAAILSGVVLLYAIPQMVNLREYFQYVERSDTRIQAREWLLENVGIGKIAVIESYTYSANDTLPAMVQFLKLPLDPLHPQTTTPFYDLRWYDNFDYVVTSSYVSQRYLDRPTEFPAQQRFYRTLESNWPIVERFAPEQVNGPLVTVHQNPRSREEDEPFDRGLIDGMAAGFFSDYTLGFLQDLCHTLWNAGYCERAITAVEQLILLEERMPGVQRRGFENALFFAKDAVQQGEYGLAIRLLQQSVDSGSDIALTYTALVDLLVIEGRHVETGPVFRRMAELDIEGWNGPICVQMGSELLKLELFDEAIKAYHKAIDFDANDISARVNLSWAYFCEGDIEQAILESLAVLQRDSNRAASFNLGLFYVAGGKEEESHRAYARACADFGAEAGKRIGAVQDLQELIQTGKQVDLARAILQLFWPGEDE
jgi:tetratricopeptide (TPR) repeat protein